MRAIVTAGPTLEALDPVRFLSNRSSGKQGFAIAAALRQQGFDVTLVTGPVALPSRIRPKVSRASPTAPATPSSSR
jgi:phosphopantothenoylcysteine synthetase/decarboxylase